MEAVALEGHVARVLSHDTRTNVALFLVEMASGERRRVSSVVPLEPVEGTAVRVEGPQALAGDGRLTVRATSLRMEPPLLGKPLSRYLAAIAPWLSTEALRLVTAFDGDLGEELVPGVPHATALRLREAWRDHDLDLADVGFLRRVGCPMGAAAAVVRAHHGESVRELAGEDPYGLTRAGLPWSVGEKLGRSALVKPDDPQRIAAALREVMRRASEHGDTACPHRELLDGTAVLADATPEVVQRAILASLLDGEISEVDRGSRVDYQTRRWRQLETELAADIARLSAKVGRPPDVRDPRLDPDQRAAVSQALAGGVSIVTGGPGTGKTTSARKIIEGWPGDVVLMAPTGMAAKRLGEATGATATTIHVALRAARRGEGWAFGYDRSRPLHGGQLLVVVDEATMLDGEMGAALMAAVPDGAGLVLLGDVDQLPAVGPGNVFADLITAGVPTARLRRIWRQAGDSPIPFIAASVRDGEPPEFRRGSDASFVAGRNALASAAARVRDLRAQGAELSDIRVLAPQHRGPTGVDALNLTLKELWNPTRSGEGVATSRKIEGPDGEQVQEVLAPGDRIMVTANDALREARNGDLGTVVACGFDGDHRAWVEAIRDGGGGMRFEGTEVRRLKLAYATTVHKAQGSEAPHVVFAISEADRLMADRALVYTAITRARNTLTVVGDPDAFDAAVLRAGTMSMRQTGLEPRVRQALMNLQGPRMRMTGVA
ncbi:hypothetical protein EPN42_10995 [bacterium]|nr:MAG: hypothetical protein EPN42_10995 [bacterium]